MLVNNVIYTFPADRADEAERLLIQLRDASRAEAGCVSYDVARGTEDPNLFILFEIWQDQAALDFHYATEHFARLGLAGIRTFAASRTAYYGRPL